ncbi:imm11 family protein [Pyxidicoccus sp. 3LFB2]
MAERFFDLSEDIQTGNWDLGDPLDERGQEVDDPWAFTKGQPVRVEGRLTIPVEEPGRRLDFSTAGVGVTPVVHVRVATLFAEMAPDDVQLIPVDIKGCPDQYLMLIATKLIRCIDDTASREVRYWKPEHGRPDKLGQYRSVAGMRIDRSKVGGAKVFRTWGWKIALIVSEDIKTALEREKVTGVWFTEV